MGSNAPSGRAPGVDMVHSPAIHRSPGRPDDSPLCGRCAVLLNFDMQMSMETCRKWKPSRGDDFVLKFKWPVDDLKGLFVSILTNSAQGCKLCKLLEAGMQREDRSTIFEPASLSPDPDARIVVTLVRRLTQPIHQVEIRILGKKVETVEDFGDVSRSTRYLEMSFDLRAVLTDPTHRPYLRFQPEIGLHMASAENVNFAKDRLKRCVENHTGCAARNDPRWSQAASPQPVLQMPERPSRLLDLAYLEKQTLHLCNTSEIEEAQYAALSYCWGTGTRLVTTTQNITQLSNGFSFDSLPATIADAVTVTSNLGIRYLWVDSFCIVQNSDDDKNIELPKMTDIYKNARVTIIAAAASSAFSGFLAPRKCPEVCVRHPLFGASKGIVGEVILRHLSDVRSFDGTPDATETRAWCLQEGILSARCLVFSKLYLYWCCQGLAYARRGVTAYSRGELPTEMENTLTPHLIESLPGVFRSGRCGANLTEQDRIRVNQAWRKVVRQFSLREITDPMDRSRAIAGLASAFHATSQDRYLAGMWESTLICDLNWSVSRRRCSPRSPAFRFPLPTPSWSWISADPGEINLPTHEFPRSHGAPETIRVAIHLAHPAEPFGHVASAKLHLSGRVVKISVWAAEWEGPTINNMYSSIVTPLAERPGRNYIAMDRYVHDGTGKPWNSYRRGQEAELWALQLAVVHINSRVLGPGSRGILMIPSPDGSSGTFMRVGSYSREGWNLDQVQPELVTII